MASNFRLLPCYLITIASFLLSSCTGSESASLSGNSQPQTQNDIVDAGYARWHQQVLQSKNVINGDKRKIETSYDTIRNFDRKSITVSWFNEISSAIAENNIYRQSILDASGDNKLFFAEFLLKNPKNSISYQGASDALISGLKRVASFDYQYRDLSNAFEDSARGRRQKTLTNAKNISAVQLYQYSSKNNTPSVAEQLLTAAAIKILELNNNPKLQVAYNQTLFNKPIENCLGNAQRNSAQCKAASYDKNDLSFCMAKHAIGETSQCFSWILP